MGRYQSMYLGPYASCPEKETTVIRNVAACSSAVCPKAFPKSSWDAAKTAFCAECGSPITSRDFKFPSHVNPHDVLGERENLVPILPEFRKDKLIWFLSNHRGPRGSFQLETGEDLLIDVRTMGQTDLIDSDLKWFQATFHKDLQLLRNAYDTLTLSWGLLNYYR